MTRHHEGIAVHLNGAELLELETLLAGLEGFGGSAPGVRRRERILAKVRAARASLRPPRRRA